MRASFAAALFTSSACSSDDADPVPRSTFNTFVLEQFDATSDMTQPVRINGLDFTFFNDPNAFNSLLQ